MRVSTLAKFRAGRILTFAFVVIVFSIIGLLILLWIELTNPGLFESASASRSPKTYFGCLLPVTTRASSRTEPSPSRSHPSRDQGDTDHHYDPEAECVFISGRPAKRRITCTNATSGVGSSRDNVLGGMHKGDRLTDKPMRRFHIFQMIKRRAKAAALPYSTCCHTFRVTGITAYLENGGTLEHAQTIANHDHPGRPSFTTERGKSFRLMKWRESKSNVSG